MVQIRRSLIQALLTLAMASQHRQLQLKAIQTIVLLAQNNRVCCNALIQAGAAKSLQTVLDQGQDSGLVVCRTDPDQL